MPPRFVEAKTLEAVLAAKGKRPRNACTAAQKFFLDREHQSGGSASVLIVGPEGWIEISWADADKPITEDEFEAIAWGYTDEGSES